MKPYFVVEAYTNVGRVCRNNEDNYYVNGKFLENAALDDYFILDIPMQKGVFGVFDGMGGGSDGEFASHTAATTLSAYQHDLLKNPDEYIAEYVRNASERISDESRRIRREIGSTMAVAVISEDKLKVYNIGDTRIYYLREGKLYQVSKDHIAGTPTGFADRGMPVDGGNKALSQYLGIMQKDTVIRPFVSQEIEWGENDVLLICSNGVTDVLSDSELEDIINQCSHKGFFAEHIVKSAIRKGGKDNATAVIVQACDKNGIKSGKSKPKKASYGIIAAVLAACLTVGCVAGAFFNNFFKDDQIDTTTTESQSAVTTTEPTTLPTTEPTTAPITDDTSASTSETTETTTSTVDSSTTVQAGNVPVSEPDTTKANPQITTLNTAAGAVDLRSRPQMGAEYVIREESEAKEVKIYSYSSVNEFFWVYVELDGQFYWVRADGISGVILQ